ncbi:hypothetical protein D9619_003907 [Psilocybe cf. subviscida]|uniref:DUF5648 domain-containing protein n=1 Tax=Psilocybe cf. subviscida TaxID=2480587 RepID=A0A8H5BRK4_9AGAR|nr:hypothetical protein D9619_003907 [Psilocybe cf. subviscida]
MYIVTLLGIMALATVTTDPTIVPAIHGVEDVSPRSTDTCADPSLARTIFQAFSGSLITHILHFHYVLVASNSQQSTGPAFWNFQGPVFKAWPTQQAFTAPLFRLTTATNSENIFLVGVDAQTPPVVSGFSTSSAAVVAWVYNTSVCGSVPLMSAVLAAKSDHYYTTDPDEHTGLLSAGWADSGVVMIVMITTSISVYKRD